MQKHKQLAIAVIGAGLMGNWHAHAARKIGATITAFIDPNLDAANTLVDRHGGQAFPDLQSAMEAVQFDVVHICTPLETHVSLAEQSLISGKHVIVEKPLAPTAGEVSDLESLAASKNLLLCPVHQFAFQRGVDALKRELSRRSTGPLSVSFDFASAGGEGRHDDELNQILIEILPHPLSILSELWPDSALAQDSFFVDNPKQGELFVHSKHLGFPVSIKLSLHARPTHCSMTVYHEEGAIHLNLFHGFAVFESAKVSRFQKIVSPFALSVRTFLAATANLVRRVLSSEPAYPGLRALIGQCYRSIEQSKPGPISGEHAHDVAAIADLVERRLSQ